MTQAFPLIVGALVSLVGALSLWIKVRPEVRAIDTRTEGERYDLEQKRRTEQREAEERLADKLNSLVENITGSYQQLMTTVNAAHDKVVEGMRAELRDVRDRLTHVEGSLLQERSTTSTLNETIFGLNATILRLNEAVADRDATIRRIREKLNQTQGVDADTIVAESVAPERRSAT